MTDPRRAAGDATGTLSRARLAVSAAFAAQGFGFAAMLTSEPGFKERFGINDLAITLVILGVCVLAGLGSATAEAVAHRWGSARALVIGLVVAALGVGTAAMAPGRVLFFAGFHAVTICRRESGLVRIECTTLAIWSIVPPRPSGQLRHCEP